MMCLCRLCFYLFIFVNKLNLQPRPSFESSRAELVEMDVVDWLSSAHKLYEEKLIHELECCEVKRLCQPSTCYLSPQPSSLPSSLRSLFFFYPHFLSPLSLKICQCLATCLATLSLKCFLLDMCVPHFM